MLSWRAAARERPGSRVCKPFGRCDTWAPAYLRPSLPSPAPTQAQTMRQLRLRPCLPQLSRKPVSDRVSGLLTATTAAELPLEPLPRYRRSLTSSPPSLPFRLSPARAACVVGGPATARHWGRGSASPPLPATCALPLPPGRQAVALVFAVSARSTSLARRLVPNA